MMKKIAGMTILLLFAAALIYGGVNRTQAKVGDSNAAPGAGTEAAPGRGQTESQATEPVWRTVNGVVASAATERLVVAAAEGEIEIAGRAWSFAQQAGFSAQVGDSVRLTGFDENGVFEPAAIANAASGQQVQMRGEGGRPLWAGRGGASDH